MEMRINGFEELAESMRDLEISEQKEKLALRSAGDVFVKAFQDAVAEDSGASKRSIKRTISRADGMAVCRVYVGTWYYSFPEFGTSKDKSNVGRVERAIESCAEKAIQVATDIMLK